MLRRYYPWQLERVSVQSLLGGVLIVAQNGFPHSLLLFLWDLKLLVLDIYGQDVPIRLNVPRG